MSIRELHDWAKRGGLIPAGSHLQEAVDAIRELQRQINQFSTPEEFTPQERFLAVITNGPSDDYAYNAKQNAGAGNDWPDFRYWVKRVAVWGSGPNALAALGYDTADEVVPGRVDVFTAINLPEMIVQSGGSPTHTLPSNETLVVEVFGWWDVGNPQTKHYFFSSMPSRPLTPLKIMSAIADWAGGTGAARYEAGIGVGPVTDLDADTDFNPPDANMTFPMAYNAIAVDVYEGGSAASGTCVITAGSIVLGTATGTDDETPAKPVYYFSSAPSGTLFKVLLAYVTGVDGTATTPVDYEYNLFLFDGSALQLGDTQRPDAPRPNGQLSKATMGWAYITQTGTIQLAEAIEPPITATCVSAPISTGSAAGPSWVGF